MRKLLSFSFAVMSLVSCKKQYTCQCFNDRKGFVTLTYSASYKEKKKSQALSKCENAYKSTSIYHEGDYCLIQ